MENAIAYILIPVCITFVGAFAARSKANGDKKGDDVRVLTEFEEDDACHIGPIAYSTPTTDDEYAPGLMQSIKSSSEQTARSEPSMRPWLELAVLQHETLEAALAEILAHKLASSEMCADSWRSAIADVLLLPPSQPDSPGGVSSRQKRPHSAGMRQSSSMMSFSANDREQKNHAFAWPPVEGLYDLPTLLRADLLAVTERDPACLDAAHCLLHYKGFLGLQAHRVAHVLWTRGRKPLAHAFQSRCSEVFGMDLHPNATIGKGVMFDHGTGVVVGETARIGDECSLLHGVTLGGTGKKGGRDRHPKLGNCVLVGAGASILGNIRIGDRAKIGCGSVVLSAIPTGATAVGAPAKVVGRSKEAKPSVEGDSALEKVDSSLYNNVTLYPSSRRSGPTRARARSASLDATTREAAAKAAATVAAAAAVTPVASAAAAAAAVAEEATGGGALAASAVKPTTQAIVSHALSYDSAVDGFSMANRAREFALELRAARQQQQQQQLQLQQQQHGGDGSGGFDFGNGVTAAAAAAAAEATAEATAQLHDDAIGADASSPCSGDSGAQGSGGGSAVVDLGGGFDEKGTGGGGETQDALGASAASTGSGSTSPTATASSSSFSSSLASPDSGGSGGASEEEAPTDTAHRRRRRWGEGARGGLTADQHSWRSIWHQMDQADDGFLTPRQFHDRLNKQGSKLSQAAVDELFFLLDNDNDGVVSEAEFVEMAACLMAQQQEGGGKGVVCGCAGCCGGGGGGSGCSGPNSGGGNKWKCGSTLPSLAENSSDYGHYDSPEDEASPRLSNDEESSEDSEPERRDAASAASPSSNCKANPAPRNSSNDNIRSLHDLFQASTKAASE